MRGQWWHSLWCQSLPFAVDVEYFGERAWLRAGFQSLLYVQQLCEFCQQSLCQRFNVFYFPAGGRQCFGCAAWECLVERGQKFRVCLLEGLSYVKVKRCIAKEVRIEAFC